MNNALPPIRCRIKVRYGACPLYPRAVERLTFLFKPIDYLQKK
jgi:hypothetical protein